MARASHRGDRVSESSPPVSAPAAPAPVVCVVEPDAELAARLARVTAEQQAEVVTFGTSQRALEHLATQRCDVIVASDGLEGPTCPALLRRVQNEHPEVLRVVLSDRDGVEVFRRVPYAHQFSVARPRRPRSQQRSGNAWSCAR